MGRIGSGKGTVGEVLVSDYNFRSITIGDMVREEVINRGLQITREMSTNISDECRKKDPSYFIKKIINKIKKSGHDKWIIDGIRQPIDVTEFRKAFPDIKFILVDVSPRTRFERLKERGRVDAPKTIKEFDKQDKLEEKEFKISKTLSNADFRISNEGSKENLRKQVFALMKRLL